METVAITASKLQLEDKDQDYYEPRQAIPDSDGEASHEAATEGRWQAIEGFPMRPSGSRSRGSRSLNKEQQFFFNLFLHSIAKILLSKF